MIKQSTNTKSSKGLGSVSLILAVLGIGMGAYYWYTHKTSITGLCKAEKSQFPLPLGAGSITRSNYKCERNYIQNVQAYLNVVGAGYYFTALKVDGDFGAKTLAAYQAIFGDQYTQIEYSAYQNILNDLSRRVQPT